MGARILHDAHSDTAALFCSTSVWAFGPVFSNRDGRSADERAEAFLRWLAVDPRSMTEQDLAIKHSEWFAQEEDQIRREEAAAAEALKAEEDRLRFQDLADEERAERRDREHFYAHPEQYR